MLPLWDMLQDEELTSPMCAPDALQIAVPMLCVCGLFAWPLLQEQPQCPMSCLRANHADLQNSRLQARLVESTHEIWALSPFKLISQGIRLPCVFCCVLVYFLPPLQLWLPSTTVVTIYFSPRQCLCMSCPPSVWPPFYPRCGVCSAGPQIDSCGIQDNIIIIQLYLWINTSLGTSSFDTIFRSFPKYCHCQYSVVILLSKEIGRGKVKNLPKLYS